jgi:hypothetical protein
MRMRPNRYRPRWAAFGGNGSVVPMMDPQIVSDRDEFGLWLRTAIRSVAEDEFVVALVCINRALDSLERIKGQGQDLL